MAIRGSDEAVVLETIDPVSQGAGSVSSGWVNMAQIPIIQAIVLAGVLGASATLDGKLQQATDSSGTGAKDITGKSITQLTKAGSDDNKQAIINCRASELDVAGGFSYVRLTLTVGTAASLVAGVILGHHARYQVATDVTTVDEVV